MEYPTADTGYITLRMTIEEYDSTQFEVDFLDFIDAAGITQYILAYEEDAARPHYHTIIDDASKSLHKLKQIHKTHFPYLKGNKGFAFTPIKDAPGMLNYVCKGGNIITHSIHFTPEAIKTAEQVWLSTKGKLHSIKEAEQKKSQTKAKENQDKWLQQLKNSNLSHNDFPKTLSAFIIKKNINNWNINLVQLYYRIFIKEVCPDLYEKYILTNLTDWFYNNKVE